MAKNAASREITRLAYMRQVAPVTISLGGTAGVSPGMADRLRERRMSRRMAVFGSGWRFELALIAKAELAAENRPAYRDR